MFRRIVRFVVPALMLALALPVLAGEGRIPIWQPIQINPGGEGKYILTRDITGVAGAPAIEVTPGVGQVDIDLNGHTVQGSNRSPIWAVQVDSLTVRNGSLVGGTDRCIYVELAHKVVIEDVRCQDNGLYGIALLGVNDYSVRHNIIVGADNQGVVVDGSVGGPGEGSIEDNHIRECGEGIAVFLGRSVGIHNNRIETTNSGAGIRLHDSDASLVTNNSIHGAHQDGIVLREMRVAKIYNNVVQGSGQDGISLLTNTSDCLVLENTSSRNSGNGIYVTGVRNQFAGNVCNFNGLAGVWFDPASASNTFGGNVTRGNLAPPSPCAATPPPCLPPDVCDDGAGNTSFADNMGPGAGC